MSASRGIAYRVVSAEELLRRETDDFRRRLDARCALLQVLRAEVGRTVCESVGVAPSRDSSLMVLNEMRQFETELTRHEKTLREVAAAERAHAASAVLKSQVASLKMTVDVAVTTPSRARERTTPREAPGLQQRLQRVLEVASQLADRDLQGQVREMAEDVTTALGSDDVGRGGQLVTHLEQVVTAAARQSRAKALVESEVVKVELQYSALDPEVAGPALLELRGAKTLAQVEACARGLAKLDENRRAESDRHFVMEQSLEVLREMGYVVDIDPGEATNTVVATSDRWPHYGLQLAFRSDLASVHTAPLAFDETDSRDDIAFEEATCRDLDAMRTKLAVRGVNTDLFHHVPAGALAIRHEDRRDRKRTRSRPKTKERGL